MIKIDLIKKLRLKKGCRYILFFPKSAGLSREELQRIDYHYVDLSFLVESTKGIKAIEIQPNREDELFDKDMRWTRIHEMIKMRAPISASDRNYYLDKLK